MYQKYSLRFVLLFLGEKKIGKELKNLNFLKKNTILLIEQIYNKGAVESYPEYEERIETEEEQFISLTTVPHENVWYEMLVRLN